MKKYISLAIALIMALTLAACSGNSSNNGGNANRPPTQTASGLDLQSMFALAESRGHTSGEYASVLLVDLLFSEYLTIDEKASMLRANLDMQYEANLQATNNDEILIYNTDHMAKYEQIYDFLSANVGKNDVPQGFYSQLEEMYTTAFGMSLKKSPPSDPGTTPQQSPATSPTPGTTTPSPTPSTPSPSPSPSPVTLTMGFDLTTVAGWVTALDAAHDNTDKALTNFREVFSFSSESTREYKTLTTGWPELINNIAYFKDNPPIYEGYYVLGNMVNGKPDGLCYLVLAKPWNSYSFDLTNTRIGTFKNGELNGFGRISYPDTEKYSSYTGYFKDGKFHGLGVFSSVNEELSGEWSDGMFTGYGLMRVYTERGKGVGVPYTSYAGYFENSELQSAGRMNQFHNSDGTSISVFALFDGENANVLDIEDITARANEAVSATVNAMRRVDEIAGNAQDRFAAIQAQSKASLTKFKAGLAASQPPMRIIFVPEYGTTPVERKAGYKLNWVVGY